MNLQSLKSKIGLGFLTVVEHPEHGLFGGYLAVNSAGRPLEFHCTAPIKPNRAQQILYGPTLGPFLYGEQIGGTLLAKARIVPIVVCTDCEPALAVRGQVDVPVALVLGDEDTSESPDSVARPTPLRGTAETIRRLDAAHPGGRSLVAFQLGLNRLAVGKDCEEDRRQIVERIGAVAESFDLAEPFGRIREAIDEARRGGHAA